MRDALLFFQNPAIKDVYVVPNFISEGYFTETVIPRELELSGRTTERTETQTWKYCEPVGSHAWMTELLLQRAREIAPEIARSETTLLVVAHGTSLNDNSAVAAKRQAEALRLQSDYTAVLNVYMEEPPLVSNWAQLATTANVVVVPFFISDGLHSYQDIPILLGIAAAAGDSASKRVRSGEIFRQNPYHLRGHTLYYASSIGTDPRFVDVIIDQVAVFDRSALDLNSPAAKFTRGSLA